MEGFSKPTPPPEKPKSFIEQAKINAIRGQEDLSAAEEAEHAGAADPMDIIQERAIQEEKNSGQDKVNKEAELIKKRIEEQLDAQKEAESYVPPTAMDIMHERALKEDASRADQAKIDFAEFFPEGDYTATVVRPSDIDYEKPLSKLKIKKEFTVNPDTWHRDFSTIAGKQDTAREYISNVDIDIPPSEDVAKSLLGLEYKKYLMEHPEAIPKDLDAMYKLALMGSLIRDPEQFDGEWQAEFVTYDKGKLTFTREKVKNNHVSSALCVRPPYVHQSHGRAR